LTARGSESECQCGLKNTTLRKKLQSAMDALNAGNPDAATDALAALIGMTDGLAAAHPDLFVGWADALDNIRAQLIS
jgi:hypothetical protein